MPVLAYKHSDSGFRYGMTHILELLLRSPMFQKLRCGLLSSMAAHSLCMCFVLFFFIFTRRLATAMRANPTLSTIMGRGCPDVDTKTASGGGDLV
jgi:hypothetical protein